MLLQFEKLALMTPQCSDSIDKREGKLLKGRQAKHARNLRIGNSRKSVRLARKGGKYATGHLNFWDLNWD